MLGLKNPLPMMSRTSADEEKALHAEEHELTERHRRAADHDRALLAEVLVGDIAAQNWRQIHKARVDAVEHARRR
jgi:hypothetical protein